LICLAIGSIELIWGLILKFIPVKFFQCIDLKTDITEEVDEKGESKPKAASGPMALKRLSTQKAKAKK